MARNSPPLSPNLAMVDPDTGKPTPFFMRWWQDQIDSNKLITDLSTASAVSAVVDLLGNVHGSVLYRSSTAWTALIPGTSGQVLTTQGAGANPQWADIAGTFLDLSDTPSAFTGQGGNVVAVNVGETALEFIAPASGGGGSAYDEISLIQGLQGKSATIFSGWTLAPSTDPSLNDDIWVVTIVGQTDNPPTGMTFDGVSASVTWITSLGTFDRAITGVFRGITGTGSKTVTVLGSLGTQYRSTIVAYQLRGADPLSVVIDAPATNTAPASLSVTPTRTGGFAYSLSSVSDSAAATVGGTLTSGVEAVPEGTVETTFRTVGYRIDGRTTEEGVAETYTFEESVGSDDRNIGHLVLVEPRTVFPFDSIDGTDIDFTPSNGDVLTYNSTTGLWENATPATPSLSIDDLTDVDITTVAPTDGQVLKWVAADSEFQPADESGGGGVGPPEYVAADGDVGLPFGTAYSGSAFAAKGNTLTCNTDMVIGDIIFNISTATGTYNIVIGRMSGTGAAATIVEIVYAGSSQAAVSGQNTFDLSDDPPRLRSGETYAILCVRTDGTDTAVNQVEFPSGADTFSNADMTQLNSCRYAEQLPVLGDVPYFATTSHVKFDMNYFTGDGARSLSTIMTEEGTVIDDLSDVNAPSPTDGQVLTWEVVSGVGSWVPATPSGGGGGGGSTEVVTAEWEVKQTITTTGGSRIDIDVTDEDEIMLIMDNISTSSSGFPKLQMSTDGGSTVLNGSSDYFVMSLADGSEAIGDADGFSLADNVITGNHYSRVMISGLKDAAIQTVVNHHSGTDASSNVIRSGWANAAATHDTLVLIATAGTFDGMDVTVLRRKRVSVGSPSTESIIVAASDETTALTTGTGKLTFRMPYAFTLTEVRASVTTAPTGAAISVDINEGGVSVLSTALTIDATEKTSTTAAVPAVISDTALADDAEITIDIDQVGSTIAGAGLKVTLIGTRP